jgi:NADH:ubiquinone oxidoreductase subunit F (NADH-binding)/NAD-dependent dihydropyrimidine dehydrogenase PreA subunit
MLIGAFATGATEGVVYVRNEYPLAIKHLTIALRQARELGLLGEQILGTGFSFNIGIVRGAGAFVCGEETALIHSVEGKTGEPSQRPPFPVEKGIDGKPTAINNVETWANIPTIINGGGAEFAKTGTKKNSGTKIFSLVGKVKNTGLVEVPMGISIREIVDDIGGGPSGKARIKAVQTGGPSGGCIPASMLDLPIDYESLQKAGSMMGSGGMIVMDEDTCVVDVSKFFIQFTNDESCGKCVSCRDGSAALLEVLTRIADGEGREGDVEFLEELGAAVKDASMCGLGQTLPNPVLSTLKYFRDEYEAHIKEKRCPARVCKNLIQYYIDPDLCVGCLKCLKTCPSGGIKGELKHVHYINQNECTKCGQCLEVCPPKIGAVVKLTGNEINEVEQLTELISCADWKNRKNGRPKRESVLSELES